MGTLSSLCPLAYPDTFGTWIVTLNRYANVNAVFLIFRVKLWSSDYPGVGMDHPASLLPKPMPLPTLPCAGYSVTQKKSTLFISKLKKT